MSSQALGFFITDQVVQIPYRPAFLIALLVGIAVFATVFTILPALGSNRSRHA